MFASDADIRESSKGGFTITTHPRTIKRVLYCKRRWIQRQPTEILAEEFSIVRPTVQIYSVRPFDDPSEEVFVLRRAKKHVGCLGLIDGDEIHINTTLQEPVIQIDQLPYIISECDEFLAVYKPHGLPTTPQGKFMNCNLHSQLERVYKTSFLQPINRLDRCTGGVVVFAKSPAVFANRNVLRKLYIAKVGVNAKNFRISSTINLPLTVQKHVPNQTLMTIVDHKQGKESMTKLSRAFGNGFLRCEPVTGRTHQLRVHLAATGAPIEGDLLYDRVTDEISSQPEQISLFAWRYEIELSGMIHIFSVSRERLPSWLSSAPDALFDLGS